MHLVDVVDLLQCVRACILCSKTADVTVDQVSRRALVMPMAW